MVRRAPIVAVNGRQEDLQTLLGQDDEIDRLESAILVYIGRLSQVEHTEEEGRQMGGLAQIANILESIGDVVTTNLVKSGSGTNRWQNYGPEAKDSTRQDSKL